MVAEPTHLRSPVCDSTIQGPNMKKLIILSLVVFVAVSAWSVGNRLSSDALSMGVGILFGVLAGLPTALLVLASNRRREESSEMGSRGGRGRQPQGMLPQPGYGYPPPQQPPVIVLAGGPMQQPGYPQGYGQPVPGQYPPHMLGAPRGFEVGFEDEVVEARSFRVIGEEDGMVDEF